MATTIISRDSEIQRQLAGGILTEAAKVDNSQQAAKMVEHKLKAAGIEAVARVTGDRIDVVRVLRD